ncbi:MAG: porin [Myxococcota bacterium]
MLSRVAVVFALLVLSATAHGAEPRTLRTTAVEDEAHAAENVRFEPGQGLRVSSDDGDFSLDTRLRAQFLWSPVQRWEPTSSELEHRFEIRRARLQFDGHAFGPETHYKLELAFSPRDLGIVDGVVQNSPLLSWYVELGQSRDFTVRMGQYKIPYSRQRVASSGNLQLVDRSLANGEFNRDRDIGLDLRSEDLGGLDRLRYYVGAYMGEGRDLGGSAVTPDFSLLYLARLEWLPLGDFDDYTEGDLERRETAKLSVGAAYAFHDDAQRLRGVLGERAADGGTTDYHAANLDYAFKLRGFSSTGELHWREGTRTAGSAVDGSGNPLAVVAPRNGLGWHLQCGYVFDGQPLELAARYAGVRRVGLADPGDLSDTDGFTSLEREDEAGIGLSYYWAGHSYKLQGDAFHRWRSGLLRGETVYRVQLQLGL